MKHLALAITLAGLLAAPLAAQAQKVKLATTAGDIVLELDAAKAPKSVANFVQYVKAGHYSNTVFHRVIDSFMIQGGGMTADLAEKPTRAPIPLEAGNGLSNLRGTLAMARRGDADSATSQFFFNVQDNTSLDYQSGANPANLGYAVFGRIISGLNTLDAINVVPTYTYSPTDIEPRTEVLVYWAQRLK